ncbi:hydroxyacid dehydrogenase [Telmatospirillum sp. J64-1]|uniref:hydroxyacid dehydrogenase n=1 Tax=Telmatospirillum sp. J64-1 TaxID=2502183 RepID=UPI00115DD99B|nr:hydroxyacid dehydrogenase [Telmatospirillum sp. J64-1]
MSDIVISEFMDEAAVASLASDFRVLYDPSLVDQPERLVQTASQARAIIVRNRTQVRAPLIEQCRNLRVVGRLGVGLDNIDVGACRDRGIAVLPATGANDVAVAEYVITGLLMLWRGAYFSSTAVAQGQWPREALIGGEAMGRTLGLVGFGGIARQVAKRARALGIEVLAYDPHIGASETVWMDHDVRRCNDLDGLLSQVDALSLHVPLTPDTRGLLGRDAIARMRPGAVVINTARGGILDEAALAQALQSGHLGGAMLDVFEQEPLAGGSVLADIPNLILTPHIAGVTAESNIRVSAVTAANVRRVLEASA